MQMTPPLWQKVKKSLLMEVRKESKKVGLKLNIRKTKIMASSPITSWQIDVETMETVTDFIFLGYKITADDDCSHEIKRRLLLGRKVMTNLESILKSGDITLSTKFHLVKAKGGVVCVSEVIDISPSNLDSSLCFFQSSVSHDVLCTKGK